MGYFTESKWSRVRNDRADIPAFRSKSAVPILVDRADIEKQSAHFHFWIAAASVLKTKKITQISLAL